MTEQREQDRGLAVERFDITIDGADQIAPDGWLVKGEGAAHTREKIIAAASDRFVVIADSGKTVDAVHAPIPVEMLAFWVVAATVRRLTPLTLRDVPRSPDGASSATTPVTRPTRPPSRRCSAAPPVSSSTGCPVQYRLAPPTGGEVRWGDGQDSPARHRFMAAPAGRPTAGSRALFSDQVALRRVTGTDDPERRTALADERRTRTEPA